VGSGRPQSVGELLKRAPLAAILAAALDDPQLQIVWHWPPRELRGEPKVVWAWLWAMSGRGETRDARSALLR
jgi:hypothetical protein